jgi:putative SOS response-associated peptidase YedK
MCGRYSIKVSQVDLEKEFRVADAAFLNPRYNAAPGQRLPIIRSIDDVNSIETVRWGIIPSWSPDGKSNFMMINARADGLAKSRVFKKLLDRQRCLVPASGFYEWEKRTEGKQPVHIVRKDGRPFGMAGLWERWTSKDEAKTTESFTIITTDANDFLSPLHDRMPVILDKGCFDRWLDPEVPWAKVSELTAPAPENLLRMYPVTPRMNTWKFEDPACIEELEDSK